MSTATAARPAAKAKAASTVTTTKPPAAVVAPATTETEEETASEASDGESLSSEGEYEKHEVERIYRPSTVSDQSAYDVQLPPKRQRPQGPDSSRTGRPDKQSKVLDYATYTKAQAKAELAHAVASAASPKEDKSSSKEYVPEDRKKLFLAAYDKKNTTATSKIPDIDFSEPAPEEVDESAYNPQVWGGLRQHERVNPSMPHSGHSQFDIPSARPTSAAVGSSRPSTASVAMAPGNNTSARRSNRNASIAKSATVAPSMPSLPPDYGAGGGGDADDEYDAEEEAVMRERQRDEIREEVRAKARAQLHQSAMDEKDPAKRDFLRMMELLRKEADEEAEAKHHADMLRHAHEHPSRPSTASQRPSTAAGEDVPTATGATFATEVLPAPVSARGGNKRQANDRHFDVGSSETVRQTSTVGAGGDENQVLDLQAVSALYQTQEREAQKLRDAAKGIDPEYDDHRKFFDAVTMLEEMVSGDALPKVINKFLEKHRIPFQASKPARERGEFTHSEHATFQEFSKLLQEFIFSRIERAVGGDFDVEDFFTRVFDEDGGEDAEYPLLSTDTWEVLLAMLNFESFVDLMDHYIYTRNNLQKAPTAAVAHTTTAAPATSASSSAPSSDAEAVGAPLRPRNDITKPKAATLAAPATTLKQQPSSLATRTAAASMAPAAAAAATTPVAAASLRHRSPSPSGGGSGATANQRAAVPGATTSKAPATAPSTAKQAPGIPLRSNTVTTAAPLSSAVLDNVTHPTSSVVAPLRPVLPPVGASGALAPGIAAMLHGKIPAAPSSTASKRTTPAKKL
jgi:hypothetical protein